MTKNFGYLVVIGAALACPTAFAQSTDTGPTTANQPVHKPSAPPTCVTTLDQPLVHKPGDPPVCVPTPGQQARIGSDGYGGTSMRPTYP